MLYYIWSHEHEAWWKPNRCGYTVKLAEAGKYTKEDAIDITFDNIPYGEEVAIPLDYALRVIDQGLIFRIGSDALRRQRSINLIPSEPKASECSTNPIV